MKMKIYTVSVAVFSLLILQTFVVFAGSQGTSGGNAETIWQILKQKLQGERRAK